MKIGDRVAVVETGHGFKLYRGMVGTVSKSFDTRWGRKVVVKYPPQISAHHGGTYTPHPYETFARHAVIR